MHNSNALKIGLFGANCSSGRCVTLAQERWTGNWDDTLELAKMADDAGIDFMLPIGRWKGYGGDTDYQGSTLETMTWASGLLSATKRITVFGTVHAPLFHPLIAAKEFVTADHIGHGRFGLNTVCAGTRASSTCSAFSSAIMTDAMITPMSGSRSSNACGAPKRTGTTTAHSSGSRACA